MALYIYVMVVQVGVLAGLLTVEAGAVSDSFLVWETVSLLLAPHIALI